MVLCGACSYKRHLATVTCASVSRRHQSDGLLGGQPQLRANLRGAQSPQRHTAKSSLEEDLKKLITLDSPPPTTAEEKVSAAFFKRGPGTRVSRPSVTDFPLLRSRRFPARRPAGAPSRGRCQTRASTADRGSRPPADTVTPPPTCCSAAPPSRARPPLATDQAAVHRTNPWVNVQDVQRDAATARFCHSHLLCSFSFPGDLTAPESSELERERKRQQMQEPVLMPLAGSGADGPLDWAHLVDAAKAFEGSYTLSFLRKSLAVLLVARRWRHRSLVAPGLNVIVTVCHSEQRLVFLAAQEDGSKAESGAATSPQQAEPQAAPVRQPSPG